MDKAKVIEKMIEERGLSRRAFAEKIGLPPTTLNSMLTRGVGRASIDNVIKVCRGLGISVEELNDLTDSNNYQISDSSYEYPEYEDEMREIISRNLKKLMSEYKINQSELAKIAGVSESASGKWVLGKSSPRMGAIQRIADHFNLPKSYILSEDDKNYNNHVAETAAPYTIKESVPDYASYNEVRELMIYGNISCGTGTLDYGPTTDSVMVPRVWLNGGNYFALIAQGDSMTGARITEGDILVIREQNDAENGEIAAVLVDDEIMLKRIYKTENSFMLLSENPKYEPRVFDPSTDSNIRIIGKLKKAITDF